MSSLAKGLNLEETDFVFSSHVVCVCVFVCVCVCSVTQVYPILCVFGCAKMGGELRWGRGKLMDQKVSEGSKLYVLRGWGEAGGGGG